MRVVLEAVPVRHGDVLGGRCGDLANDAARREEEAYLEQVREIIRAAIQRIESTAEQQRKSVLQERRYVWENVTHDSSTPESAAIQALHLTGLIDEEREYLVYRQVIEKLERIQRSPYFGRMDFREQGQSTPEKIYIGISSLRRPDDETPLIYDWRAPISSMFYDFGPGPAHYDSPAGTVNGEITLKRQFQIVDGKLEGLFDTDVRIGDDVLQKLLARHADQRMTSIVSTIQREQNRAIRDLGHRIFIVAGPAGSGKTSVALQRVAFLLYHLRGRVTADQILLLSPNRIFEDYVSNVLPELGEANMRQSTFLEQVRTVLRPPVTFEDMYAQLDRWLDGRMPEAAQDAARVKLSDGFAELLRRYLARIAEQGLDFPDLTYRGQVIVAGKALRRQFCDTLARHRPVARVQHLRRHVEQRIRDLQEYNRRRYEEQLFAKTNYVGTDEEIRQMAKVQSERHAGRIREQAHRLWLSLPLRAYRDLLATPGLLEELAPPELAQVDWGRFRAATLPAVEAALRTVESGGEAPAHPDASRGTATRKDGATADPAVQRSEEVGLPRLPYDDAIPLAYLYAQLLGPVRPQPMRHVLVDEAQDYTALQYETLAVLYPHASFTILGDARQSVHPWVPAGGFERVADRMLEHLTQPKSHATMRLTRSYRSTAEILAFAGAAAAAADVQENHTNGETVGVRIGHPRPRVRILDEAAQDETTVKAVREEIKRLRGEDMRSIAVVCRTDADAGRMAEALRIHHPEVRRIRTSDEEFRTGLVVLPSYLAKGLEYDAVIAVDAESYGQPERALLYTVCTRALHRLTIIARGEPQWLARVPEEMYHRA
jgi:DNA helicase-2/ATP-dependent DNA helicase PcrA